MSGAAIALSPSPLLLPIMAAEITKVTFRFGLVVDQVCRSSEVSPDEINAEGVSTRLWIASQSDDFADFGQSGLGILRTWY